MEGSWHGGGTASPLQARPTAVCTCRACTASFHFLPRLGNWQNSVIMEPVPKHLHLFIARAPSRFATTATTSQQNRTNSRTWLTSRSRSLTSHAHSTLRMRRKKSSATAPSSTPFRIRQPCSNLPVSQPAGQPVNSASTPDLPGLDLTLASTLPDHVPWGRSISVVFR